MVCYLKKEYMVGLTCDKLNLNVTINAFRFVFYVNDFKIINKLKSKALLKLNLLLNFYAEYYQINDLIL